MGHRGKGEGSVYQRKDGYWVGAVEVGGTGPRRKARVVRRYRKDVVEALDELRRQARHGVVPDRSRTVAAYLRWWLDEVKAADVSPGSLREYRTRVNRINKTIGTIKLGKLTPAHVQHLANRLVEDYPRSPTTRAHTLTTLRSALRWAVQAEMIPRNPAEAVTGPRGRPTTKLDDRLDPAELQRVLAAAEGDRLGALWWLACRYGLRLSELMRLRWSDVDWSNRELTVRRAKTTAGVRTLPLIDEAATALRRHRLSDERVSLISGHMFTTDHGTPLYGKYVYKQWNALLARAGVAHRCRNCGTDDTCSTSIRRFHSSRHTAATTLLEAGVPVEIVSAVMGHTTLAMTIDTYARVRSDLTRRGLRTALEQCDRR